MKNLYCGIDFHKNKSTLCFVNELGEEKELITVMSKRLVQYLSNKKDLVIGIEASGGTNDMVAKLKEDGHNVKLINPNKFKAIGLGGKKTDKKDATAIAQALRLNFIPEVYHKTLYARRLKSLLVGREMIVRTRVNMTNHIRGLLREYGITIPQGAEAFWENIYEALERFECPFLKDHLEDLTKRAKELKGREKELENRIRMLVKDDERVKRLQTLPGIGIMTSSAFVAVLDDAYRFKNSKHFASYIGLVPREHSSGEKKRMGNITRSGSELLRRYLIHGARTIIKNTSSKTSLRDPNRLWVSRVRARAGMNKATVALAHRMSRIGYAMIRDEKSYSINKVDEKTIEKFMDNASLDNAA